MAGKPTTSRFAKTNYESLWNPTVSLPGNPARPLTQQFQMTRLNWKLSPIDALLQRLFLGAKDIRHIFGNGATSR